MPRPPIRLPTVLAAAMGKPSAALVAIAWWIGTLHHVMNGTETNPPPAPTSPDSAPIAPPMARRPPVPGSCRLAAGGAIGMLSGLVGAGGGFISVPFMTWCNVPIHNAIATSAALGFPIALASTAGNLVGGRSLAPPLPGAFGYLYLPALAAISAASVLMAPLGARAAHALDVRQLKRVFALLLYVLAGYMLWKGLSA